MASLNKKQDKIHTHEGATAQRINPEQELKRSVMACLLWEDQFYESGESIADRIKNLVMVVDAEKVHKIAIEARNNGKLRHVPLLIARYLAKQGYKKTGELLSEIIQRPDELTEFLAIYWKDGKQPLSAQVKKGLAKAFTKFSEYQLAKYNRDNSIKLRDVLFLSHAKPKDESQANLWKRLVNDELKIPDTWEVSLSTGKDKNETFTRLINENKLGALALLRNLRNMVESGVNKSIISKGLSEMKVDKVLPFRFISAAKYAVQFENEIEKSMLKCLSVHDKLPDRTLLLIDISGSMDYSNVSSKSDLTRLDAACGLAILAREICEDIRIFTFSNNVVEVPPRRGFSLKDAVIGSQLHGGTYLGMAVEQMNKLDHDRLIVITDEQSHDRVGYSDKKGYMINVSSYQNGIGYGKWTHIDGWSESVIDYIMESEKNA